jgi:hypothetical protein
MDWDGRFMTPETKELNADSSIAAEWQEVVRF